MKIKFLLIFAFILAGGIGFAQDNRVLTFDEAKQLADRGDAYGEAIVAFHYSVGWQTEKNLDLAAKYAISSTQKGHPLGAFRLGALLRSGDGIPKNEAQGLDLQSKAIAGLDQMGENPYALTALGVALFQGKVVREDKKMAAQLYKRAADMDFAPAQFNFAMCASTGHGMPKNESLKIEYIGKAAQLAYPPALESKGENSTNQYLASIFESEMGARFNDLFAKEKYHDALPLAQQILEITEKNLGPLHPDTATAVNNLAVIYGKLGNTDKSVPLYERALAIREKSFGPAHPATEFSLNNLANAYQDSGKHEKALPLLERLLKIQEKTSGPDHPDTATSLCNLANSFNSVGEFAKAISFYKRASTIRDKTLGPTHNDTLTCINDLACVYHNMGDNANALALNNRYLELTEKKLGAEHPDTIRAINNVAMTLQSMGEYFDASKLLAENVAITKRKFGINNPSTAIAIHNLAYNYTLMGQFADALPLAEHALAIREKKSGSHHPDTIGAINNLAMIYEGLGDYAKATPLFERALAVNEKVLGEFHKNTIAALNNLAANYNYLENYAKALPLFERAVTLSENLLGPRHPTTAIIMNSLAWNFISQGNRAKALPVYEQALSIHEQTLGFNHPTTARTLSSLASYYRDIGDYAKALPLYQRALVIYEKALGQQHPDTAIVLNAMARLYYNLGETDSSRKYAIRSTNVKQKNLQSILILDERSRLAWQNQNNDYWTACVLTPDSLQQVMLIQKGAILESLSEDRAGALAAGSSGEGSAILQKIKALQSRLSKIALEQGKESEVTNVQDQIGLLQRELTSKYLGRERQRISASITMADIMPALAGGGVLLDFIQFNDPKLKGEEAICLGAIITGEDNKPIFVRIDGANAINRSIDTLRTAINQGNSIEVEAQTNFLSEKLWAPLAAKIPEGTKRLFLCPDANLNFLSFAALLESDGRFVAEKYPITYIGSARDLAKKPSGKISKSMALIANPQFDATSKSATNTTDLLAMRSAEADVFGSIALPPLPGTEAEATSLQALATESGWQTKSYLGKDATETIVRNTKKPGVLHLATHGFYLNSFTPPGPEGSRGMSVVGVKETTEEKKKKEKGVDPMRASGVAFTGAQQTLTSWSHRKAPNPETDGVLTAEEVGALRLDGTWLVTLSACETGVGEARSGEGVFGLRRAFMIAGAENLLMTLWPVADETTAKIMTDFYKEAFATGDAPGSLAKVQRDWLVKLRQERGLLAAVREAGPFAMVAMTAPSVKTFETNQN